MLEEGRPIESLGGTVAACTVGAEGALVRIVVAGGTGSDVKGTRTKRDDRSCTGRIVTGGTKGDGVRLGKRELVGMMKIRNALKRFRLSVAGGAIQAICAFVRVVMARVATLGKT